MAEHTRQLAAVGEDGLHLYTCPLCEAMCGLEIRVEAFNVLNRFRPENPVTNLASNRFGLLDRSRDPRILQFAAKFAF